jgi:hypothetical protein
MANKISPMDLLVICVKIRNKKAPTHGLNALTLVKLIMTCFSDVLFCKT